MSFELTLVRLDGTTRTFGGSTASGADRLLDVDIARTHTGLSDFEATVPRDAGLEDAIFADVEIARGGDVLFRGRLEEVRSQFNDGTSVLAGRGRGVELTDDNAAIRFQNRFVHEAVEEYIREETAFAPAVTTPTPNVSVDDERAGTRETTAEFESATSLSATDPVVIEDDTIRVAQTCYFVEAENADDRFPTPVSRANSSGGAGVNFFDDSHVIRHTFDVEYKIPAEELVVAIRFESENIDEPPFQIRVDGTTVVDARSNIFRSSGYSWAGFSATGAGSVTGSITVEFLSDGSSSNPLHIDCLTLHDARFHGTDTFDNTLDANGFLSSPALFPEFPVQFGDQRVPLRVTDIGVDATVEPTDGQARNLTELEARLVGGSFAGRTDTSSIDVTASVPGSTIQTRVTFGPTDRTRTTATPTQDFEPQTLSSLTTRFDGDDLGVIEERTFEGSDLSNLQRLVEAGAMRFAIPHNLADADKEIQAFRPSDEVRALPDVTVLDEEQRLDVRDYANRVTVRGARRDDGTRPSQTIQADDEIAQFGEQTLDVTDPSVETTEAAASEARRLLSERLDERDQTGRLEIVPEVVLPGPSRTVTFRDGTTVDIPLEEVQFREAAGEATGTLQFSFSARLAERIARLQRDTAVTRRSF